MTIRQKLAQWFYSPGAYGLWIALDDVENWHVTEHVAHYRASDEDPASFRRKPSIAAMWIASGWCFFDGYPEAGTPKFLGWYERRWLWKKYKRLNNRRMLYRFTRLEDPK